MDYEGSGLLDGLEGAERQARIQLLDLLVEQGFGRAELNEAAREHRLMLLPVEQALGGRFTAAELAQRSGVPAEMVIRAHRLLGLPQADADEPVFGDADVDAARSMKVFLDSGMTEAALAETTRVLGEAMARVAATVTGSFAESFLEPGDSEDAVAVRFAALARELLPRFGPVLSAAFAAHLREAVSRGMITRSALEQGSVADAQELAVCFADLVGFTRLGGQLDARELGTLAGQLAELSADVAEGPVRLVKTIGDAAMFVSREPARIVAAALALVERAPQAGLPSLRAGIAFGPTLQRAGDYYGNAVNLASRVTGAARPDSVLCTQEVHDAAPDVAAWSPAGHFRLKGVRGATSLYRARPPQADAEAEGGATVTDRATSRRAGRSRRSRSN